MVLGYDGIVYLAGSAVLLWMYTTRRKRLTQFRRESLPDVDPAIFSELTRLLESCYERMLFLAVALLVLASVSLSGLSAGLRAFFLVVVFVLFFASIAPRHKVMKMLVANGISLRQIKDAGLKL